MTNKSELSINLVMVDKPKSLLGLDQNGKQVVIGMHVIYNAVNIPVGKKIKSKFFRIII